LAQVTTNDHQSETTSITPFNTNSGCHSHLNLNLTERQEKIENLDTQEHATKQHKIHSLIQAKMGFAQARQQENANK
jgi:hypothetical protein